MSIRVGTILQHFGGNHEIPMDYGINLGQNPRFMFTSIYGHVPCGPAHGPHFRNELTDQIKLMFYPGRSRTSSPHAEIKVPTADRRNSDAVRLIQLPRKGNPGPKPLGGPKTMDDLNFAVRFFPFPLSASPPIPFLYIQLYILFSPFHLPLSHSDALHSSLPP